MKDITRNSQIGGQGHTVVLRILNGTYVIFILPGKELSEAFGRLLFY